MTFEELKNQLSAEINRNRILLDGLQKCGPSGAYVRWYISEDVKDARNALTSEDGAQMLKFLDTLRQNN